MQKTDVALVFPPVWDPKQPYLALPALAARLRGEGFTALLCDDNIDYFHDLLSRSYLEGEVLPRLERLAGQGGGARVVQALEQLPGLADEVDEACRVLRDPERFFDLRQFHGARAVLDRCVRAASAAYGRTKMGFYTFSMRYPSGSSKALEAAAQDEAENPFLGHFRRVSLPRLKAAGAPVVGISVSSVNQSIGAFSLARLIKEELPGTLVVVGGNTYDRFAGQLRSNTRLYRWIDGFVVGEGETAVVRLAEAMAGDGDLGGVPNLFWRRDWRERAAERPLEEVIVENARAPAEDLDALPPPDFDGLPLDRYFSPVPVLPLETSRGCPWARCAFCSHFKLGESFRFRKPAAVLEDLRLLRERYGAAHIVLVDNSITVRSLREISRGLVDGGPDINWTCYTRYTKSWTPEFCKLLAEAGCRSVWFGLESAAQRVLEKMDKGTTVDVARQVTRNCLDAGIAVDLFCMVGFPTETAEEALETLAFILELRREIVELNCLYALEPFALDSCSRVGTTPGEYGVTIGSGADDPVPRREDADLWPGDLDVLGGNRYQVAEGMSQRQVLDLIAVFDRKLKQRIPPLPLGHADREAHTLLFRSSKAFRALMRSLAAQLA